MYFVLRKNDRFFVGPEVVDSGRLDDAQVFRAAIRDSRLESEPPLPELVTINDYQIVPVAFTLARA